MSVPPTDIHNLEAVCRQRYKERCLKIKEIGVQILKSLVDAQRAVSVEESHG